MPPADGDLPQHARFRAVLKDEIRCVVIRYPTWQEMIDAGGLFDAIVGSAVSQIVAHQDCDAYLLVGYSFGGFVAWETACRLVQMGRRVAFVGLIDTRRAWDRPAIDRPEAQLGSRRLVSFVRFLKAAHCARRKRSPLDGFCRPLLSAKCFGCCGRLGGSWTR
jgi:thioesterase domain-containing protein